MGPEKHNTQNDSPHFTPEDRRLCTFFEAVSMSLLNVLVFAFLLAGRKFLVVLAMFWPALAGAAVLLAASIFLAHRRNNV